MQKNKKVGYFSERRARQSVYDHLTGSPWHKDSISHEEACEWADTAVVETWEVSTTDTEGDKGESDEDAEPVVVVRPSHAKRRKLEDDNVWYDRPECAPAAPKPKQRPAIAGAPGGNVTAAAADEIVACSANLQGQINQQTRNAFNLVKAGLNCKIKIS